MNTVTYPAFATALADNAESPVERTFSPEVLGVKDPMAQQIKNASYKVGKGELTIEDAIANYGIL